MAEQLAPADGIEIDGMGHDLPPAVWPRVVDAIERTARRAQTEQPQEAAWR